MSGALEEGGVEKRWWAKGAKSAVAQEEVYPGKYQEGGSRGRGAKGIGNRAEPRESARSTRQERVKPRKRSWK